jgi:hypothetical protein
MTYQSRADHDITSFVVKNARVRGGYTLLTDVTVYAARTVLAQVTASGKLVPFTDEAAVDGSKYPKFILKDEHDATGGDVTNVEVYEMGEFLDRDIVIRASKTLATFITLGTNYAVTVRQALQQMGIYFREDIDLDGYENA